MSRRPFAVGLAATLALLALPAAAQAATHTATCVGSSQRCTATFPLRGTHTGDRLVVQLPDTDLQLRSIVPSSPSLPSSTGSEASRRRWAGRC
jgi:hypothetical protein